MIFLWERKMVWRKKKRIQLNKKNKQETYSIEIKFRVLSKFIELRKRKIKKLMD